MRLALLLGMDESMDRSVFTVSRRSTGILTSVQEISTCIRGTGKRFFKGEVTVSNMARAGHICIA